MDFGFFSSKFQNFSIILKSLLWTQQNCPDELVLMRFYQELWDCSHYIQLSGGYTGKIAEYDQTEQMMLRLMLLFAVQIRDRTHTSLSLLLWQWYSKLMACVTCVFTKVFFCVWSVVVLAELLKILP